MLPSNSDSFPHLTQKRRLQLGFVTHLLTFVRKSVVLNLFSLLGSSSSSNVDASSYGCVVILSPYLTLNFVISSLIVGNFKSYLYHPLYIIPSVPVAARSKAYVCGRLPAEIVGSNPTGGMDVCLLRLLCVVRWRSLRRADHSPRGVLPTVVRRCM